MHNDNKAELRRRINEACPELLKLEFGCDVRKYQKVFTWIHLETDYNQTHLCTYADIEAKTIHQVRETIEGVEQFEILGKPPELSHLLRTIMVRSDYMKPTKNQLWEIIQNFDLNKSVLEQDEPVIEALLTITV